MLSIRLGYAVSGQESPGGYPQWMFVYPVTIGAAAMTVFALGKAASIPIRILVTVLVLSAVVVAMVVLFSGSSGGGLALGVLGVSAFTQLRVIDFAQEDALMLRGESIKVSEVLLFLPSCLPAFLPITGLQPAGELLPVVLHRLARLTSQRLRWIGEVHRVEITITHSAPVCASHARSHDDRRAGTDVAGNVSTERMEVRRLCSKD
ncbi:MULTISPECIES: hypothetical protein [unclassified Bradyrhizobium]